MPANPEGIRRALEPQPMPQLPLFSEQHKKRVGMARAAGKNPEMLEKFREIAEYLWIMRSWDSINIDDVRDYFDKAGIPYTPDNWMGHVFTGKQWERIGFKASTHKGSHGRAIGVWRRK